MALKRYIALIIGNSHYDEDYYKDLANSQNEADAMACVFSKLKCEVLVGKDFTHKEYGTLFDCFLQNMGVFEINEILSHKQVPDLQNGWRNPKSQ